ncbi:bifunctional 2',3'-cyclic-nucleotide 2'-phosphodiesterase/3'-nucleotidase [Echinimonas agarilytica]|uniref:Bifunctional 2',3'-cyclic-nucleotide 2'-phosphodiesterase/3'-nucleotidase n=1 Tax=Echinimonas agarilytica TaxID=1215918 RepID=A0AA41W3J3_9GAMM|nr:bifunctional 2',3'-cyclic-nucleotide 2'-phosphodiesterase/3'-nucleotidase [Echinimonas agarilytica]MCM2678136.1 bifunctional 2',3'-cyclic-nucleotide 2'-phosphodiesterase/3'-nucleotidase [Echinimonas agarilytica]
MNWNRYYALFIVSLVLTFSTRANVDSPQIKLRILETTDIHMHLTDYDYYRDQQSNAVGLSRVAPLIHQARSEVKNSVLVDNGDLIQGSPLGDYIAYQQGLSPGQTHAAYRAMNPLNYDVGNLGNHEFNFGLPFLDQALSGANFPYISANVYLDDGDDNPNNDEHYLSPYIIQPKTVIDTQGKEHTLNIGYIGFTPPQITLWDMDHLRGKVIAKDIVETAKRLVPEMKLKGADIVIAIPHSGLYDTPREGMDENATYYLAQVPSINAIMFGHSHRVFPGDPTIAKYAGVDSDKGTVFGVASVMPGYWGSHLGIIDLTLSKAKQGWQVTQSQSSVRAIAKRVNGESVALVEADQHINAAIAQEHEATLIYMRQKVGSTPIRIHSYFALVQDDPSIQLVNNAQRLYAQRAVRGTEFHALPVLSAAAPFKSGGRSGADYYTDIPVGDIALINLKDLYVYPNDLKVVKVTGAQVLEWLERSAGQFNQIDPTQGTLQPLINRDFASYNFDVIDGIEYQIDVTQPSRYNLDGKLVDASAHRIVNPTFNGQSLPLTHEFLVATNNYRAAGGGHFPNLDGSNIVIHAPDKNRDVVGAYLTAPEFNPKADGNWSFANTFGKAKVIYQTSSIAKSIAPESLQPHGKEVNKLSEFILNVN